MAIVGVILAAVAATVAQQSAASEVRPRGCSPEFRVPLEATPVPAGPMRLAFVACVDLGWNRTTVSEPIVSPDGRRMAHWHGGVPAPIEIAAIGLSGRVSLPNRVTFRAFGPFAGAELAAFAWSADSASLWTVQQRLREPGGFALSGLTPVRIESNGRISELPPLIHSAGPLDAIQWVGNDGVALAQFGSRGQYYRPAHPDPSPTLAIVDASRGTIRDAIRADSVRDLRPRIRSHGLMVQQAAATILRDGRVRAVLQFGPRQDRSATDEIIHHPGLWLVWTEGERPRTLNATLPDRYRTRIALSPDGSKLLVVRPLQPEGIRTDCRIPCPTASPPPTPITGTFAELLDVSSGRVLWRATARVDRFWNERTFPAISPDGRYALVAMPPEGDRLPIGLLRMRDGRVIQKISPVHSWSYAQSVGFVSHGRRAWLFQANRLFGFDLGPR